MGKGRNQQKPPLGFEVSPSGKLLSQFVDLRARIGAAYERCIGYSKEPHVHDRVNLCFPRSSSRILFTNSRPAERLSVDETTFLWMPAFVRHRQDTQSAIYDNLAIFPSDAAVRDAHRKFQARYGVTTPLPHSTLRKRRSPMLDELLLQYFAERVLERKNPKHLEGLGGQILEETLRIALCPKRAAEAAAESESAVTEDSEVARAVRFIEARLFDGPTSAEIARAAGASQASLFRKFARELGRTPGEYLLSRRMDEAKALLARGQYPVSDVALIVGYADLSAFSKAFKAWFGKPPSDCRA